MLKKIYKKLKTEYEIRFMSDEDYIKKRYKEVHGKELDFNNLKTFTEKLQWRKLFEKNKKFSICADKYLVRDYVKEKIGDKYLIKLFQVVEKWEDLKINELPNQFVIKTTHDSGTVFIVKDRSSQDFRNIKRIIKKSLKRDFGKYSKELWYSDIKPRIIIEELLLTKDKKIPFDYKFHVFQQENKSFKVIIQVDYDRFTDHTRAFYDEEWKQLPYITSYKHKILEKVKVPPKNLKKMIDLAKILAEEFTYVRVDFYDKDDQILMGEMTFAHGSGMEKFTDSKGDLEFGNFWKHQLKIK